MAQATSLNQTNLSLLDFYVDRTGTYEVTVIHDAAAGRYTWQRLAPQTGRDFQRIQDADFEPDGDTYVLLDPSIEFDSIYIDYDEFPSTSRTTPVKVDIKDLELRNSYLLDFGDNTDDVDFEIWNDGVFLVNIKQREGTRIFRSPGSTSWQVSTLRPRSYDFNNLGNVTGAITADFTLVDSIHMTLTGNVSLSISNPDFQVGEIHLRVIQDAVGGHVITFPASVLGDTSGLDTTANSQEIISMYYDGAFYHV